ncbi:kelch repeat domain containing protein [Babesia bovis T2Bo]|uniref:kelch repeat domain containing protein n=1 Tax=Babesia bovis T2Bo TaxID=484906 RepID=UPI001C35045D|nr:kelch repeat domain containing protein [Babesia bovis T2Bo]EDO05176.2 kelch repeat domain containing protein [Babesia bovis T2Bo]
MLIKCIPLCVGVFIWLALWLRYTDAARWKVLAPAKEDTPKYHKFAYTFSESLLYTFGGESEGTFSSDLKRFDPWRKQWVTLPSVGNVPAPRAGATLTKIGSTLYLIGGYNQNGTLGTISQYDVINNKWTHVYPQGVNKFLPRSGHASCTDGVNRIYIFGGYNDDGIYLNDLHEITISTKTTTEPYSQEIVASFKLLSTDSSKGGINPSPKECASMQLVDGKLYLHGGYSYGGSSHDDMWTFDLGDLKWSQVDSPVVPPPSEGMSSLSLGRSIFYFGGCDFGYASTRCYSDLWRFDTTSSRWYIIPTSGINPSGRAYAALAFVNDTFVLYGGSKLDKKAFDDSYQLVELQPCTDPDHTCLGRGSCLGVSCRCNTGFTGYDCSISLQGTQGPPDTPTHTEM